MFGWGISLCRVQQLRSGNRSQTGAKLNCSKLMKELEKSLAVLLERSFGLSSINQFGGSRSFQESVRMEFSTGRQSYELAETTLTFSR